MNGTVEATGTFRVQDFWRFRMYHGLRFMWPIVILLLATSLAGLVLVFFYDMHEHPIGLQLVVLPVLWASILVVPQYFAASRQFKAQPHLSEPIYCRYDAAGMHVKTALSEANVAWKAFLKARETGTMFVLYTGPNLANLVPKRFFATPEKMAEFHTLVSTAIAPKALTPPNLWSRWW